MFNVVWLNTPSGRTREIPVTPAARIPRVYPHRQLETGDKLELDNLFAASELGLLVATPSHDARRTLTTTLASAKRDATPSLLTNGLLMQDESRSRASGGLAWCL